MGGSRKPFIAGNWKMHNTVAESVRLARGVVEGVPDARVTVMIAPAFTSLAAVSEIVRDSPVELGAQNMGPETKGAHTGEVSVQMLKELGVGYVILGHSERRHTYHEPDDLINAKVRLALAEKVKVILCVGETLEEREQNLARKVVENQIRRGLDGVAEKDLGQVTVAYEPVWAIGTGKTATPEDADAMHAFVRVLMGKLYSETASSGTVILYGGSVKPDNVRSLMSMENVDGALVGGASLKTETFLPIVRGGLGE
ncbi:MAG: triose-phosphate isomerase [Candidatus Eisenbacteria bacterium]|nr:triose-phosphate isomerase [Candidatus Eisenbacteria bacterium]